jgi:hypothetical protein
MYSGAQFAVFCQPQGKGEWRAQPNPKLPTQLPQLLFENRTSLTMFLTKIIPAKTFSCNWSSDQSLHPKLSITLIQSFGMVNVNHHYDLMFVCHGFFDTLCFRMKTKIVIKDNMVFQSSF